MEKYLCLSSIATLLIGLHWFSPNLVNASIPINLSNIMPSEQFLVSKNTNISPAIPTVAGYTIAFHPPDKGGPRISRSSGTR
ncbi:MAG TPA: hypothetical protein DEG17_01555 [Cyanobacteria bacterium UBA11149]|nr:hypothetical protein [Cyanobacteria bacterium UBA11367]HBE57883.1 hypothetical protein [Cyanobacteria bacterium UBA11366]HBK62502.1 hypothetical protein [Cyanobacteria bacterium UBA11166]HBS67646.1 hypothetical protein [Cyanobacteria bacterium UBA11153]HBW87595.1 hypothetical protein [Cyanobacteria bacterium UBA11149]